MSLSRTINRNQQRQTEKKARALARQLKQRGLTDYDYVADDRNQTFSAIAPLLIDFLNVVGITSGLDQHVNLRKRHSTYRPNELSGLLIMLNLLGIDRIENCRALNPDQVLLNELGLPRIPDPQTLRDELERYHEDNITELFWVNREMLMMLKHLTLAQEVDLHFDAKVITVFGDQEQAKVGYNPRYPGRKSYHLKVCTLEPFGFIVAVHLQPGNAVSSSGFVDFYKTCVAAIPQDHFVIKTVRVDSGFFFEDGIEAFEADYIFFEVVAKKNVSFKKWIAEHIREEDYQPFGPDETIAGAAFTYRLDSWRKPREFVVVRKLQQFGSKGQAELFPTYRYQVICHNQPDMTPQEVWQDYNQRARCELNIRDLDYDHFVTNVPSGQFLSNFAWFWHCVLAHNLMVIFRRFLLPKNWASARTSTLRKQLINVPGRLVNLSGRMTMRLIQGFPHVRVFAYVKERLRWLVERLYLLPV